MGATSPAIGIPAITAPSGGVNRGVPKGNDAPKRMPIVRPTPGANLQREPCPGMAIFGL